MPDVTPILIHAATFFGKFLALFMAAPWLSAWLMHRGFARAKTGGPPRKWRPPAPK